MKVDCLTNFIKETSLMSLPLKLMIVPVVHFYLLEKRKLRTKLVSLP